MASVFFQATEDILVRREEPRHSSRTDRIVPPHFDFLVSQFSRNHPDVLTRVGVLHG
jgi:hypothetical protein